MVRFVQANVAASISLAARDVEKYSIQERVRVKILEMGDIVGRIEVYSERPTYKYAG